MLPDPYDAREARFLTGCRVLRGDDVLQQVADGSRRIARDLDAPAEVPLRVAWHPVLTDADAIRRVALEATADDACVGVGVITRMHTSSPAKARIAGPQAPGGCCTCTPGCPPELWTTSRGRPASSWR